MRLTSPPPVGGNTGHVMGGARLRRSLLIAPFVVLTGILCFSVDMWGVQYKRGIHSSRTRTTFWEMLRLIQSDVGSPTRRPPPEADYHTAAAITGVATAGVSVVVWWLAGRLWRGDDSRRPVRTS